MPEAHREDQQVLRSRWRGGQSGGYLPRTARKQDRAGVLDTHDAQCDPHPSPPPSTQDARLRLLASYRGPAPAHLGAPVSTTTRRLRGSWLPRTARRPPPRCSGDERGVSARTENTGLDQSGRVRRVDGPGTFNREESAGHGAPPWRRNDCLVRLPYRSLTVPTCLVWLPALRASNSSPEK